MHALTSPQHSMRQRYMRSHALKRHCLCVVLCWADTATVTCWTRWGHCKGTLHRDTTTTLGCPAASCNTRVCHASITCDSLQDSNMQDSGLLGELQLPCVCVLQDNMARIILEGAVTHIIHFATLLSGEQRLVLRCRVQLWSHLEAAGHTAVNTYTQAALLSSMQGSHSALWCSCCGVWWVMRAAIGERNPALALKVMQQPSTPGLSAARGCQALTRLASEPHTAGTLRHMPM